ncbi:MAG: type 4a pilus biogenesis protein PilO [Planctomycetaceae bacterium]|nr:type 4a pilus biogenesis protein PilO [Planctomycetaceae bacterium]
MIFFGGQADHRCHRLNQWGNTICAFVCVVSGLLMFLAIEAYYRERQAAVCLIDQDQQVLLAEFKNLQQQMEGLCEEEIRLQNLLVTLHGRIPDDADEVRFLEQVVSIADENDIQIHEFQRGDVLPVGELYRTQIQLTGTSTYEGLCRFLFRMRQMERLFDIDELLIQAQEPGQDYQTISMSLSIVHASPSLLTSTVAGAMR